MNQTEMNLLASRIEEVSNINSIVGMAEHNANTNILKHKEWMKLFATYKKAKTTSEKYPRVEELKNSITMLGNALINASVIILSDDEQNSYNTGIKEIKQDLGTSKKLK